MAIIPHTASYPTSSWPGALRVRRCTTRETIIRSTIDRHAWSENGLKMVKFPSSLRTAVGCIFSADHDRQHKSYNPNHGGFVMQTIMHSTILTRPFQGLATLLGRRSQHMKLRPLAALTPLRMPRKPLIIPLLLLIGVGVLFGGGYSNHAWA